ncbi:unnamed protein product [Cuscuta campestris]|uniref:Uncharacterized protein n=1 Tax=Cuscuta campestris TaxID=132261 RepID=A0A484N5I5_9ASTE|nr:unnamed protein product [Cuscuta campestris]
MAEEVPTSSTSNKTPSNDDLQIAIQNLPLEIWTNYQDHLALAQCVDQVSATLLDGSQPTAPDNWGLLGNNPPWFCRPQHVPHGFPARLTPPIRREILLKRPITLGQAFSLARELAANHIDMVAIVIVFVC